MPRGYMSGGKSLGGTCLGVYVLEPEYNHFDG